MSKGSFKRSVISGILILTVSITMLIGVTYAVFNDSSSTNVNTIQAGILDVELVDADGQSLENRTVNFTGGADLLWEPDGEYSLEPIYISNKGDLDFKYKIEVTGINGSTGLDQYINWSVKVNNTTVDLADYEATLAAGASNVRVDLVGTMDHETPVDMMGASASAISIRVLAKQTTDQAVYPD